MDRLRIALAALVFAGVGTFAAKSSAAVITYTTFMDGPSEPNASLGTGHATVTYNDTAHTMRVQADFTVNVAASAPEPGSAVVLIGGGLLMACWRRLRASKVAKASRV